MKQVIGSFEQPKTMQRLLEKTSTNRSLLTALSTGVMLASGFLFASEAQAINLTFTTNRQNAGYNTPISDQYMIIGLDGENEGGGKSIQFSSHEAGQHSNRVPSTSNQDGGPSLGSGTVRLPTGANAGAISRFNAPTTSNTTNSSRGTNTRQLHDGNMAVVDPQGQFEIENTDISATIGVDCAQGKAGCDGDSTGSWIDQTVNGTRNYQRFGGGSGEFGVNGNVNFSTLLTELDSAVDAIIAFAATGTITQGTLTGQNTFTFGSGLHIININPGGEFKLDNAALTIKGNADSRVIFRIAQNSKLNINNSSIFVDNNMSLNSVLFYTYGQRSTNDILMSNAIVNGAAFWNIRPNSGPLSGNDPIDGGEIKLSNVQMCTQLIGGVVNVSNGRMSRCAPSEIPTPALLPGLVGMAFAGLRKKQGEVCEEA